MCDKRRVEFVYVESLRIHPVGSQETTETISHSVFLYRGKRKHNLVKLRIRIRGCILTLRKLTAVNLSAQCKIT